MYNTPIQQRKSTRYVDGRIFNTLNSRSGSGRYSGSHEVDNLLDDLDKLRVSQRTRHVNGRMSSATSNPHSSSGRYNKSREICVPLAALDRPFAKGHFRRVAKGVYTSGPRREEACAVKWLKSGAGFEESCFTDDVKIVNLTVMIVRKFNKLRLRSKIKVNIPEVATMEDPRPSSYWAGRKVLVEPFIENYQKFNSNSGSNDATSGWGKAMQALSHFSYDLSGGKYILCDLQGGIYKNRMILTDPAILTRYGTFGATDLGEKGIVNFFRRHVCNRYCRSDWIKPRQSPRTGPRHSHHR